MRRQTAFIVVMGALLVAGGCTLAPKYVRPAVPVPPALPGAIAAAAAGDVPATTPWQEFITDARLRSVTQLVLANNRDLRTAVLNAEIVGAQYRIQRAQLYPAAGAAASLDASRVPGSLASDGRAYTSAQYLVNGYTSWEVDLFGRLRSLKEQALDQYLATQQGTEATRISLIASTAGTWLTLAADAENRALAESTLKAQQQTLERIQQSSAAGIASDLDVRQAQTQVEAARADVARSAGYVEQDRHELELLAGTALRPDLLPANLGDVQPLEGIQANLPSEVLLRRPDVLAAEYQLKAANANIGAARAAYFPRISLTAAVGLISPALSELFEGSARTWDFNPQLTAPIFTAGARKATVEAARLGRDAAVAQYEKAIQVAFRETSDALSLRTTLSQQLTAEEALVVALQDTYRLSEARYKSGFDSYLSVLVAQRSLFAAQQALVGVRLAKLQNLVNLYKVLGGGIS
jgi:multidrug efflux system outer membrane protein